MLLYLKVLAHLKQLVNVESSESVSSGQVADHAVACEWLAESIERLEQCAHTALIRCYVRTFADVTLPLNRLLHAVQSTVCSSTTLEQNPSSTLPVVQELIADLDEHVDAIFQLAGLAAASSTDQSRSSSVRSCLLTLEWLESVLVPVLLQSCSPSSLVTQSEVHAAWWLLKQKLYCRDVEAVLEPVTRVLGLTERLSHLHESDAFMVQEQREQLHRATDELQRSMKAVSTAPENLRMRRSLLKRVQLMLTVVTRLSSSLHSTTLRDHTVLRHPMRPNVVERPVLSAATHELAVAQDSGDRSWVATSDIADIPVDVATPFRNLHRSSLRGRNPFSVNQSSLGKDSTTASSARSVSQQLVERTSYQSSREEPCADVREVTARGPTASCVTQTNEVTRSSSKSNSARSANDKVTALDPSRAVPASSSFLSNHAVVEHTDDQLLNLSAILMNKKITSSIRPNCNDSDVEPPSTFVTNFNHLKSINCTFGSVCNDTTLDITRLLASNTMDPAIRSSIRASVRSRLLRSLRGKNQSSVVKELSVDLSTIISPAVGTGTSKLPPRPARAAPHSDASVQQVSRNDAGARVCDGSVSADLQRSQSELQLLKSSSLVQDITGLIENLSTFANNFSSSCTTVRPLQSSDVSAQEKPVTASEGSCVGESCVLSDLNDFSSFDCRTSGEHRTCMSRKVDLHSDDAEMLRGIRLHGVSFSPQFPCIESMKTISVSSASSGNESGGKENIDFKATSEKKDFTALSNTKSPCEIKMLNFSKNTFNSTQIMTSVIHEAQDIFSEPTALADLSESSLGSERTPTLSADVTEVVAIQTQRSPLRDLNSNAPNDTASKKQVKFSFNVDLGNASDSMSARNDLDVSSNYKTVSFKSSVASITTPDSVDVDIPQRLLDLQTLRTKLCKLKSMFRL
ncbi:hypothetical protein FHG87_001222 [Trinorchestia longiramus]|nr:hypothetical protein FHG87_001222 [Trinorchestia longiramus]